MPLLSYLSIQYPINAPTIPQRIAGENTYRADSFEGSKWINESKNSMMSHVMGMIIKNSPMIHPITAPARVCFVSQFALLFI